jgi:hypothetical protein
MRFWHVSEREAGLLYLSKQNLLPFSFFPSFFTRHYTTAISTPFVILVDASLVEISPSFSQQASGFTKAAEDPNNWVSERFGGEHLFGRSF